MRVEFAADSGLHSEGAIAVDAACSVMSMMLNQDEIAFRRLNWVEFSLDRYFT
jgi:hypothetical protein